jgi:hypothetical protein
MEVRVMKYKVELGVTINLGNYESMKVAVGKEIDIDTAHDTPEVRENLLNDAQLFLTEAIQAEREHVKLLKESEEWGG